MGIKISVAIMYHPSREARLPKLIESCAPLVARPIVDPDPTGVRSPLRTARAAWNAIEEGATHHMVVQDDIAVTAGFADHLIAAVQACPDLPLTLYTNWNGPHNSYLIRRATAAGFPLARLSATEWAPTEALVLPVEQARAMAKLFDSVPDEFKDDDELVAVYLRKHQIPLLCTVPHLVEHADEGTISGHSGLYRATVYADEYRLLPEHWTTSPETVAEIARSDAADAFVELSSSQCLIRFATLSGKEPIEHPYGWYWYDACAMLGIDPDQVLADFESTTESELPLGTLTDIWAAGYLLGRDTPGLAEESTVSKQIQTNLLPLAIASWLTSGLHPADTGGLDEELIDLGLAAIHSGRSDQGARPWEPRVATDELPPLIEGMAAREVSSQLLTPPYVPASSITQEPHLALRVVPCNECGGPLEPYRSLAPLLRNGHATLADENSELALPVVEMLSCEALIARAVLPVTVLSDLIGDSAAGVFRTRAAAWAELDVDPGVTEEELLDHLRLINAQEEWATVLCLSKDKKTLRRAISGARDRHAVLTLPASTRRRPDEGELHRDLAPHFLTPHKPATLLAWYDSRYLTAHRQLLRAAHSFRFGTQHG